MKAERARLARRIATTLEEHWRPEGYTVPNAERYPHQWLWDSVFHAVLWTALDRPDRAVAEIGSALSAQTADGFVPHVVYHDGSPYAGFWGREHTSSITQPLLFGHALATVHRYGSDVPARLVGAAAGAIEHLLTARERIEGLVATVHPWESGADDSPRWDHWYRQYASPFDAKGAILAGIQRTPHGSPSANPTFRCASVSFNALLAFCAGELASIAPQLVNTRAVDELVSALDQRWDASLATWVDAGDAAATSGRVRTLDALLPALVVDDAVRWTNVRTQLLDPAQFDAPAGPTGVHRAEPTFAPTIYWRGPAWPQLTYLLTIAAQRQGDVALADHLIERAWTGARASDLSEYHDPFTGRALGARPHSWAGLPLAAARLIASRTGGAHPRRPITLEATRTPLESAR